MPGCFAHMTIELTEPVGPIEATADLVGLEYVQFEKWTAFSGAVEKRPPDATPLEVRVHEESADLVADHCNEPNDVTLVFVDGDVRQWDPLIGNLHPFSFEELLRKK